MGDQKAPPKRRRRTHVGVKLLKITKRGRPTWVARWIDPATGREEQLSMASVGVTSEEARRAWAKTKSEKLAEQRAKMAAVGPVVEDLTVRRAVEDYLARAGERLEAVTVEGYRVSLSRVVAWADKAKIKSLASLREQHLAGLRDSLLRTKATRITAAGRRGERRPTNRKLSPTTINRELGRIRVFFNEARRLGRTPYLDRDTITDQLGSIRGERSVPAFLRRAEIKELLEAALRHDRRTFDLTREEKAAGATTGATPRYDPIAPFVLFVLLSGCRLREARELRRKYYYPDAKEIILPPQATKTSIGRSIDLAVSPSLVRLLNAKTLKGGEFFFGGADPASKDAIEAAKQRLLGTFGAPSFTWQRLRQTCASFLTNAPAIYGAASAYMSAKRTGHSVSVAESSYVGIVRDIPKDARTLEQAMGIEELVDRITGAAAPVVAREEGGS